MDNHAEPNQMDEADDLHSSASLLMYFMEAHKKDDGAMIVEKAGAGEEQDGNALDEDGDVRFRRKSLKKARETREKWRQVGLALKADVHAILAKKTLTMKEINERVPPAFFIWDDWKSGSHAQQAFFFQLVLMSLRGEIQLKMVSSSACMSQKGSFMSIKQVIVPPESRGVLDSMPIPSRASIKKHVKEFQPVVKIWKDAGFYVEERTADGGLMMTYEATNPKVRKPYTKKEAAVSDSTDA